MSGLQLGQPRICKSITAGVCFPSVKGPSCQTSSSGTETWTLRATDQKYLESFEMWCWRRMEKISWTDRVRNEEVLLRVNEQRDILHEIIKRKANWIGHILRRNCLLKQVIEGKIKVEMEVTRRRGRRRKKLLDDLKDRMWCWRRMEKISWTDHVRNEEVLLTVN